MSTRSALRLLVLAGALALVAAAPAMAQDHAEAEELDPVHHQVDGHYLDFEPIGKVELPRIFVVRRADGSLALDLFGSSTAAVESGRYTAHFEEHGEVAAGEDEAEDAAAGHAAEQHAPLQATAPDKVYEATLVPPDGGEIVLDLSWTKHLVFAWIGALIVLLLFVRVGRRYRAGIGRDTEPRGLLQNLLETMVIFVRDEIARPNLGPKTDRYLPYLLTAFFFILTCNLLGLVPFGATATSNIMVTAVLATFTFVLTQLGGSRDYWKHILWPPGVPTFVKPILIPVEILGLFTKPFALAIRLFANMTAGHLVILSLIGLIFAFNNLFGPSAGYGVAPVSVAFSLFIYLLEILVAFIQAYVFTMLSALFIGMAVEEHAHHDEGHGHDEVHALPDPSRETIHIDIPERQPVAAG
jgi:F-type H+-transporting ATPase subunit a